MPDPSSPNEVIDFTPASLTTLETSLGPPPEVEIVHILPLQ
jgi:hypothetical protein